MAKVGDKFVIEIAEVYKGKDGKKLYRMKGFNTLIFDGRGISMLHCYIEQPKGEWQSGFEAGYEKGCRDCKYHEDEEVGMVYCPDIVGGWVREDFSCGNAERKDEVEAEPVKMPKEDEPTMPEIGAMERLTKDFFDFCNGITGKGSE